MRNPFKQNAIFLRKSISNNQSKKTQNIEKIFRDRLNYIMIILISHPQIFAQSVIFSAYVIPSPHPLICVCACGREGVGPVADLWPKPYRSSFVSSKVETNFRRKSEFETINTLLVIAAKIPNPANPAPRKY